MKLWPHQSRTIDMIKMKRFEGVKRLVVQGPTGSGKTITFLELIRNEIKQGGSAIVYTNRRTLRQQISDVLDEHKVWHGVRAAGEQARLHRNVQVSSIMTERVRSLKKDSKWDIHKASLVIVDEAHSNRAETARKLLALHAQQGATILGFTATPVGISDLYDDMISMATLSELREAGVLVPCEVYAPETIDMSGVRVQAGEYHQGESQKRVRETIVIGNVIDHWKKLNPSQDQTVLFAPGVKESRWFTQQFNLHGYPAEHIDAKTSATKRKEIFKRWADGETKIVCNFGILREGFDLKTCKHAILAQPTNRLSTFLQIVGRVIRSAPGKEGAILQDHVGAIYQHGSPNADRNWTLNDTDMTINRERKERKKKDKEKDSTCPNCGVTRYAIPGYYDRCPKCGYEGGFVEKMVRQTNGELVIVKQEPKNFNEAFDQLFDEHNKREKSAVGKAVAVGIHKNWKCSQVTGMIYRELGYIPKDTGYKIAVKGSHDWNMPARLIYMWAMPRVLGAEEGHKQSAIIKKKYPRYFGRK